MTEPSFRPIFRENGSLDPSSFEPMTDSWIEGWLRERLSGSDPYFPIDTRSDEDPESLVVGLLRDAGPAHPTAAAIGRAVFRLLDEARRIARRSGGEPQIPVYLDALLGLCERVRIEQTFSWFREELVEIADDPDAARLQWCGLTTVWEILFAAVVQAPGRPRASSVKAWSQLLREPEFSSLSLAGLGRTFEERLPYLATWWRYCPPDQIDLELEYMVERALARDEPILALLEQTPGLPQKLHSAIKGLVQTAPTPPVASPSGEDRNLDDRRSPIQRALEGAGQKFLF